MKEKLTRYNANTIVNNIFPPFSFQTKQKQINLFYKFSVQLNLRDLINNEPNQSKQKNNSFLLLIVYQFHENPLILMMNGMNEFDTFE
ncbi:hypothetical protein DERP_007739 [Dermatophagoides pteronyssinus]|uniref:Uncharacterized protein n=1 Tax=Dermatophagoides pteronyssinus TaxID=6956 RepID=A0ABQ8JLB3_DERPT|nr:hypothetical protein DERP_007739 [Dermatophagoides pteronyssinus]